MKSRNSTFSNFNKVGVVGDLTAGNGIQLSPAVTGATPTIEAVGDDTNVGLTLKGKGTGLVSVEANGLSRFIANPVAKTIVDGAATALFSVPIAALEMVGGFVDFLVRATDGTDMQVIAGRVAYASVNKAGTLTSTVTYTTAPEAKAVSAGTLTLAFTAAENPADTLEVRVQPTGSLTETTYTIEYNVQPIRGAVTIL